MQFYANKLSIPWNCSVKRMNNSNSFMMYVFLPIVYRSILCVHHLNHFIDFTIFPMQCKIMNAILEIGTTISKYWRALAMWCENSGRKFSQPNEVRLEKKGTQTCSCNSNSSSSYGRNICHLYLSIRTSDTFVLAVGSLIERNVHSNSLLRVSMHIAQYKIAELCSPSGYFIQIECHTKIRRRKRRYGSNLNC